MKAAGSFTVKFDRVDAGYQASEGHTLGRMLFEKTFTGELDANSTGEMLNVLTPVEGSAGYVAIEQVTGSLDGKSGSFVLQHYGVMGKGDNMLLLEVIPDSGTGDLSGIEGKMSIDIDKGEHFYQFTYNLP